MTPEELEASRTGPQNWKCGVYHCKAHPHVIVPKRVKWMWWTINFALRGAIPAVLLTVNDRDGACYLSGRPMLEPGPC